jgi:hypothetical protein
MAQRVRVRPQAAVHRHARLLRHVVSSDQHELGAAAQPLAEDLEEQVAPLAHEVTADEQETRQRMLALARRE